jgi:hypothetical protein
LVSTGVDRHSLGDSETDGRTVPFSSKHPNNGVLGDYTILSHFLSLDAGGNTKFCRVSCSNRRNPSQHQR